MPSSDDQHRLNSRQRREIDRIGQKFHFNLALPPSSLDEITTGPKFVVPLKEPGHLSAVTVAKGIECGVNLLGCFIEGYVGSDQALGKEAHFGKMTQAALEFARCSFATRAEEHNWYEHFQLSMRLPSRLH
jgi:hypothetical protein